MAPEDARDGMDCQTHGGGERTGHTERSTTPRGANPERGVVMSPIVVGVGGSEQARDAIALAGVMSEALERSVLATSFDGPDLGALWRGLGLYGEALRESAEKQREEAALDGVAVSPARAGGDRR
jgi:hypothetical protein